MGTDTLFEEHTIKEIQEIEKKLRNDIERKKEELRQMVGERYRDLMEAADTITEMKEIAERVTTHIKEIENYCDQLKQSNLQSGILQTVKLKVEERKKKNETLYSVAAMVKILMDTPSKVWTLIETGDYLTAVLFYLLARHTHSVLLLDPEYSELGIIKHFPIICKQWTSIHCFQQIILEKCENMFQLQNIDEEIVGPLCSKIILSGCSAEDALLKFLSTRKIIILNIFRPDAYARAEICDLVSVIQNTLNVIHAVFYSENRSSEGIKTNLLYATIQKITNKDQDQSVDPVVLYGVHSGPLFRYLPKSVSDFKPSSKVELIDTSFLQKECEKWIQDVNESLQTNLMELLNYINSIKGLSLIKEAVMGELSKLAYWKIICDDLLKHPFSLWDTFLKPRFVERIMDIIRYNVEHSTSDCQKDVEKMLEEISKNENSLTDTEINISAYVWTESVSDLTSNLGWVPYHQRNLWDGGTLGMKAYGITSQIQIICQSLDKKLEDIMADVSSFDVSEIKIEEKSIFEEAEKYVDSSDVRAIRMHLTDVTNSCFTILSDRFQSLLETIEGSGDQVGKILPRVVFIGHFCHGLIRLCPHLVKCLLIENEDDKSKQLFTSMHASTIKDDSHWKDLKTKLLKISDNAFKIWSKLKTKNCADDLELNLEVCSPMGILKSLLQWDKIEINEESEEGTSVKSVLKIPQQVSLHLYNTLFHFCCELDKIGGHALSSQVKCDIREELLSHLLNVYLKKINSMHLDESLSTRLAQTQALQLLFDVQFIIGLMSSRENSDDPISVISKKIIDKIVLYIDPFDMDVFASPLQVNIRRALQKSLLLFGMISSPEQVNHLNTMKSPPLSNIEHNVMPLTNINSRFPLLPLPVKTSLSSSNIFQSTENICPAKKEPSLESSRSHSSSPNLNIVDNAANALKSSFYDRVTTAMSSSWFGGS